MANTYGSPGWAVGSGGAETLRLLHLYVQAEGRKGEPSLLMLLTNRLFVQRGSCEGAASAPDPAYQWAPAGTRASIVTYICGLWPPGAGGARGVTLCRQLIQFDCVRVVFRRQDVAALWEHVTVSVSPSPPDQTV